MRRASITFFVLASAACTAPPERPPVTPPLPVLTPTLGVSWVVSDDSAALNSATTGLATGVGPIVRLGDGGLQFDEEGEVTRLDLGQASAMTWTEAGARAWGPEVADGPAREWVLADGVWSGPTAPDGDTPTSSPHHLADGSLLARSDGGVITSVDEGESWLPLIDIEDVELRCHSDRYVVVASPGLLHVFTDGAADYELATSAADSGCFIYGDSMWVRRAEDSPLRELDLPSEKLTGIQAQLDVQGRIRSSPGPTGTPWVVVGSSLHRWSDEGLEAVPLNQDVRYQAAGFVIQGDSVVTESEAGIHRFRDGEWSDYYYRSFVRIFATNPDSQWVGAWPFGTVDVNDGQWSTGPAMSFEPDAVAIGLDGTIYAADRYGLATSSGDPTPNPAIAGVRSMSVAPDGRIWATNGFEIGVLQVDGIDAQHTRRVDTLQYDQLVVLADDTVLATGRARPMIRVEPGSDLAESTPYVGAVSDQAGGAFAWDDQLVLTHIAADASETRLGAMFTDAGWISWDGDSQLAAGWAGAYVRFSVDMGQTWSDEIPDQGPIIWLDDGGAKSVSSGRIFAPAQ